MIKTMDTRRGVIPTAPSLNWEEPHLANKFDDYGLNDGLGNRLEKEFS
jgi:hypothetical protein